MAGDDDHRLRDIQREYLDFLDDDVSVFPMHLLAGSLMVIKRTCSMGVARRRTSITA